jgi:putative SOS response-associated peptidase YedK
VNSCAMVITKPNKFVAEVHDRMPVILEPESFEAWMRTNDVEEAGFIVEACGSRRTAQAARVEARQQFADGG